MGSECMSDDDAGLHLGFMQIPHVVTNAQCFTLTQQLEQTVALPEAIAVAGTRNLLQHAWCQALAQQLRQHSALQGYLHGLVATECTYFEKSQTRNWLVSLHQDLSIAVAERIEHPQLHGWAYKEGGWFVQPPAEVLEPLWAVRVHLDPCSSVDGPVRVVPGSQRLGRLNASAYSQAQLHECSMAQGGALLMRPLILHASSKATGDSRRRVLHFVFAPASLPYGLRWHYTV